MEYLSRILRSEESALGLHAFSAIDLLMEAHELTLPPPGYTTVADLDLHEGSTLLNIVSVDTDTLTLPLSGTQAFFLFGMRLDHDIWDASDRYGNVLLHLLGGQEHWIRIVGDQALAVEIHMLDLIMCILDSRCGVSHQKFY